MTAKQYLTVSEVARLLKVARYRVYEWVKADQIPYLRTVGRILFDPNEIEEWLRRERADSSREHVHTVRNDNEAERSARLGDS